MKISHVHFVGLAAALAQHFPELPADVLPRIIRAEGLAEYEDLAGLHADDLGEVAPMLPPASRRLCLALIKAIHPRVLVCPHDGALAIDRVAGGGWQEVDSCPKCARILPRSAPATHVYDWVANVDVDPDTREHVAPGGIRVPLAMDALEKMAGGIDPRLAEAATAEGSTVPKLLNALLNGPAHGNVRTLLAALPALPPAWVAMDGLRAALRVPTPNPHAEHAVAGAWDHNEIVNLAINAGFGPSQRDLLFAWMPGQIQSSLPVLSRPADQIRSDVMHLARFGMIKSTDGRSMPALAVWVRNASTLGYGPHSARFKTIFQEMMAQSI